MKPFQQRRPFFQAATSEVRSRRRQANVTLHERRFHLSRWIAALALTALLISCASLTPDRIQVLAAIAGQAAQIGAQQWLAKRPEHRVAFDAVIQAITALVKAGNINQADYVALLSSLPTTTLAGPSGEVYLTEDRLVIWDGELRKAVTVKGAAEQPVMKAVRDGLRRAVAPMPPALPTATRKGMPTNRTYSVQVNNPNGLMAGNKVEPNYTNSLPPVNTVVSNLYLNSFGRTNITRSVLDVQTHAGSVPVVNVRWTLAPSRFYQIQQRTDESTNWFTFATVTNQANWSMPWPPGVQAGLWRVLRIR